MNSPRLTEDTQSRFGHFVNTATERRLQLRHVLLVVLLSTVGIGVAACGSSSDDTATSQAVTTSQAAVTTPPDDDACIAAQGDSDWSVAKVICTEAAELGNSEAMNVLALRADRDGDAELADSWFEKAAALGDPDAMDLLKTLQQ